MKKIVIPAILLATMLVAGIFAFMPVEKASTVHTTIGNRVQMALTPSVVGATPTTAFDAGAGLTAAVWVDIDVTTALVGAGGGATVLCLDENGFTAATEAIAAAAIAGHEGLFSGIACNKITVTGSASNTAGVVSVQGIAERTG